MAIIEKKCWPEWFTLIKKGKKTFDLRLADFEAKEGDTLLLREYNPNTNQYTGRELKKANRLRNKIKRLESVD